MTDVEFIAHHEGCRLKPYRDSRGYLTIGYGRCLDTEGIWPAEASYLLMNDISRLKAKLNDYAWYRLLTGPRQTAILDMAFNLGIAGLLKFESMIAALERNDYAGAASAMLASAWANQVGSRAQEDAKVMREGTL